MYNGQLGAAGGRILGGDFAEVTRIFGVGLCRNGGFAFLEEEEGKIRVRETTVYTGE